LPAPGTLQSPGPGWLGIFAALAGAFTPRVIPLALCRVHELLPADPSAQRLVSGRTTMAWALFQAGAAYLYSWLFAIGAVIQSPRVMAGPCAGYDQLDYSPLRRRLRPAVRDR
jgi:hypothetical protein